MAQTSIKKATLKLDSAGKYARSGFTTFKAAIVAGYENALSVSLANTNALPPSTPGSVREAAARELAVLRRIIKRLHTASNISQLNVEDITNRTSDVNTIDTFLETHCGISSGNLG
jgi:hypothetical protein